MYSSPQKGQAFRTRAANSVPIRARQIRQMGETNRVGDMQNTQCTPHVKLLPSFWPRKAPSPAFFLQQPEDTHKHEPVEGQSTFRQVKGAPSLSSTTH